MLKYLLPFVFVSCLLAQFKPGAVERLDFDTVEEAVAFAEKQLEGQGDASSGWSFPGCGSPERQRRPKAQWAAIILQFKYSDDFRQSADVRINCYSPNGSHMLPPGTARVYFVYVKPEKIKLRLYQTGYHDINRTFEVAQGDVLVVDDLVLEKPTADTCAEVVGRVWLEGEKNHAGVSVRLGPQRTISDVNGQFRFDGMPARKGWRIIAEMKGFHFDPAQFDLYRNSSELRILSGYKVRGALVRWAYQPNETNDLSNDIIEGRTVVGFSPRQFLRFAEGLLETNRDYDLKIEQRGQNVTLAYEGFSRKSGIIRLRDIPFDDVAQAPEVSYQPKMVPLADGDVYVFRTTDGKHFAKMEVLRLLVGEEDKEIALGELARRPLDNDK
ncbi:MAG: hypothetical protein KDA54_14310 [Phycisphaerales bacterium]|nr:hypothetical protein [Phycisphaerales bacterium]